MNKEDQIYLGFSLTPGIGPLRFKYILNYFNNIQKAWDASSEELKIAGIGDKTFAGFDEFRKQFNPEKYWSRLQNNCAYFISQNSPDFPESLMTLENPPIGIFVKGSVEALKNPMIAVVGARKMTSYGRTVTEKLVTDIASAGISVVSGLAFGVDAAAHSTTLLCNEKTVAVLACGVDCCLPLENYSLYQKILENGGAVISEYPLSKPPTKGSFLARNRIVAALSEGILITEAGVDSGSLTTAHYAQELKKPVFVTPGPITSSQSQGVLALLKDGAIPVSSGAEILHHIHVSSGTETKQQISMEGLSEDEKIIVNALESEPMSLDFISKITGISIVQLSGIISGLELTGLIQDVGQGKYELIYR